MKGLICFVLILFTLLFGQSDTDSFTNTVIKDFTVQTLDGQTIRLSDYRGKVLLINVWDTVCPPCIAEFPSFIELYSLYQKNGFEILGLTKGLYENKEGLQRFVQKHNLNYPNAQVHREILSHFPSGKGIPVTYLLDHQSKLVKMYRGYQKKEIFEADIQELLKRGQEE